MAKDYFVKGKKFRLLFSYAVLVSEDGTEAYKQTKTSRNRLVIQRDHKTGRTYVNVSLYTKYKKARQLDILYIDDAVNTVFHGSRPSSKHITWHKDGKITNCHANNLEWKLYYQHTLSDSITLEIGGNRVSVHKNGNVMHDGSQCKVYDHIYDEDCKAEDIIAPYIFLPKKRTVFYERYGMDRIMDEAGYVNGDKYAFENPVVYHKDHDRMNFDSSNLEWRDRDDKDYIEYMADATDEEIKRIKELNKGRDFPNHWLENKWRDELNKLNAASGTGATTAQTTAPVTASTTATTPNPQNSEQDELSGV